MKEKSGITLIALVITIIVLLILAGVSIAMLTGDNGILSQAQRAKTETENAQAEEENVLANYESYLNSYSGENTEFTDSLGNKVVVPAGFRVVNPGDNVEDGIIIEDVAHGETAGSQFVWIPVGTIQTSKGEIAINLDRYTFEEDGNEIAQGSKIIDNYYQELSVSDKGNIAAKDIHTFLSKANISGGYYIARYEARTSVERKNKTDDINLTQITVRPDQFVYNWVTQPQAANLSRNMYSDSKFTSDLMNSYAWDTAVVFIEKCSEDKDYARQNSLNTESLAIKGTNNLETKDQICNIFDIASNCWERTTETSSDSYGGATNRGGVYNDSTNIVCFRHGGSHITAYEYGSFRPILYL